MTVNQVINFEFALSQLCGNKPLLINMLGKFHEEYEVFGHTLIELCEAEKFADARDLSHAFKGVTGNLGLTAAHQASKDIEVIFKEKKHNIALLLSFRHTLEQTFDAINGYCQQESSTNEEHAANDNGLSELTEKLERNEFINSDDLPALLNGSSLTAEQKAALTNAIHDLEYDVARAIITSN